MNVQEAQWHYPQQWFWWRISKMLKVLRSSFYVMGKVLTGELFCTQTGVFLGLGAGGILAL